MAIFIPLVTKFDDKGLKSAEGALKAFGGFAADVAKAAAAAIAAVGVASVREASQFESSIAKVEGLVGITGAELDRLAEASRRFGAETGRGAQEAAEGLFVITSAGLRGADAAEALELSLKASAAGLGATADIARAVSGALNAYGTDVIDAAAATDVIVATARAGNFETSQFAAAIGRVLPFAKQAGSSLEDMGGAVALLTKTNGDAAQSVTQIAALFRAFVIPTEEAKKALAGVGLSAQDVRDAIANQGLPAALDMLDEKLGGNREQLGRLLGSSEAASAAFQILEADSRMIADTFGVVNNAAGLTNEAFEVVQETAAQKFAVAMATARDSLIEIGNAILTSMQPHLDALLAWMQENGPAIEDRFIAIFDAINRFLTSDMLADLIKSFEDLWPEIEEAVIQLGELAGMLSPLIFDALNDVIPLFANLTDIVNGLAFFLGEVLSLFGDFEIETPAIVQFLERIFNPMERLQIAAQGAADAINAAIDAWSRWRASGFDLGLPQGGALPGRFGGRRAGGGPVGTGQGYLVGEMGPELFVPSSGGTIIPNDRMGGGNTISITVNAGMGANGNQIGQEIVNAITRYERSSGPVFARA